MSSFSNSRVWFITGSSQGLGKAILESVLKHGDRAVATLRNPSALSQLQEQYPPGQLLLQNLDVTSFEQIIAAFEAAKKHFNRLDVVVNNAGYGLYGEIESTSDEEARKAHETMFWGPVNITKQAIKFFREVNSPGHGGRIFNVSSIGGYTAQPNLSFYNSAKFALEGFTQSFIKEMPASWNITGCIIEPGGFRTEWSGSSMTILPQHPAYADPSFPTSQYRKSHGSHPAIGDPTKASEVIYKLAHDSFNGKELPLRLPLGSETYYIMSAQATRTLSDLERWAVATHSTNADDYDKGFIEVVKQIYAK